MLIQLHIYSVHKLVIVQSLTILPELNPQSFSSLLLWIVLFLVFPYLSRDAINILYKAIFHIKDFEIIVNLHALIRNNRHNSTYFLPSLSQW